MVLLILFASLLTGPLVFQYGKNNNKTVLRAVGILLWILGWSYLAWVIWSLAHVAG